MMTDDYSLLEDMIHERDGHIANLTNQLHQTSDSINSLSKELHQKSVARKQQREEHSKSIKKLKEEHLEQRKKLAKFEQSVKGGGGLRVHEYAALMRSANSNQVESSYVIRLQAQLCRAMHSLGVMESQLALVKDNCSSLIRFMKEDLSRMVDDRTRREIELMNGLAKVDQEHRILQGKMEKKINEKEELLESVREEYEELGLVYDEDEVKAALEVKYLLEQMEKIGTEKERVEKEMLQALLDREKQIVALKRETEQLGAQLESLQGSEKSDEALGDNKDEEIQQDQQGDEGNEQQEEADIGATEGVNNKTENDSNVNETSESNIDAGESNNASDKEGAISSMTSKLEAAVIDDTACGTDAAGDQHQTASDPVEDGMDLNGKEKPNSVSEAVQDSPVDDENDEEIEASKVQEEDENISPSSDGAGIEHEEPIAESTPDHPTSDGQIAEQKHDEKEPIPAEESTSKIENNDAENDEKINP